MKPWVSILTPLYNGVEFLEQCAKSVCLQDTQKDWWIGVNGHGDGGEVLSRAREIQRECHGFTVHVVNLPGVKGKVAALNALVALSSSEWVAVLDCDDTWEKDKLLVQKMAIDMSPIKIDVIGTFCSYFGDIVGDGPSLPQGFIGEEIFWRKNPIINSSALIRRELAYWEDRFGLEDYDMWLRLRRKVFFNAPYKLVNHRIHAASAFNGKGGQDVEGLLAYHRAIPFKV